MKNHQRQIPDSSPFSPVTEVRLVGEGAVSVLCHLPRLQLLLGLFRDVAVQPGSSPQSRNIHTIKAAVTGRVVTLVSVVLTAVPVSSKRIGYIRQTKLGMGQSKNNFDKKVPIK